MRRSPPPDPSDDPHAYGLQRYLARAFGVKLTSDIHERLCDLGLTPPLGRERRQRLAAIRRVGTLFVHVPKNAGMSVSHALYGRQVKHSTIRYYQRVAPDLASATPSFAVIRDPIERFLSAYRYARMGGSGDNVVSLPFRRTYRALSSIDMALDHLEAARFPYGVDHIFRAQSWYVLDEAGRVSVGRLILLDDLASYMATAHGLVLHRINRGTDGRESLTSAQAERLRRLYCRDFELFNALRG